VADCPLFVTAFQDRLSIYRDASGESLHRRGYRQAMHRASLNEAAAAGCLYLAGWPEVVRGGGGGGGGGGGAAALADPMVGSGTFLIEAALMATNSAPGLFRRWWPFMTWPDGDREAWREAVAEARGARVAAPRVELWGNDAHGGALALAARDAEAAGVKHLVRLHLGECAEWQLPHPPQLVVSNPPWGQRLMAAAAEQAQEAEGDYEGGDRRARPRRGAVAREVPEELAASWNSLGAFLKRQAGGAQAFLLSGNTQATQHLRLRSDRRLPLTIGGVDCRLLQYEIRGSAGGGEAQPQAAWPAETAQ
jgi:23S rRNA G2445 N2-methylase RlmL